MPQTVPLRPGHGAKASAIACMLHPYSLIRYNCTHIWQRDRVDGLVFVGKYFRVVRRGSPATDTFIMRDEDLPNKELYETKRTVHIAEEGPEE